jgi:Peptidase A4 family
MSPRSPARLLRGVRPLAVVAALALALAACGSDVVPTAPVEPVPNASTPAPSTGPSESISSAVHQSPKPAPSQTPRPTPTVTPRPTPAVVDGPNIVGPDIAHCPGKTKAGQTGTTGSETSTNWSGYAIVTSHSVVTCVEAEWVQPKVACHGKTHTSVSIWVGLGGFNQGRLEQIGTAIDCVGGSSIDYSWHESLPKERREVDTPVSVDPGDRIWAQVRWLSGSSYQLSLANLTTEDGFTVKDTSKGLRRTEAEWIAEAPATGCSPTCKILQMPNWGKVTFDHIGVTVNGVRATLKATGSTRVRIRLETNSGTTRAVVTKTGSDGGSFVVTWRHA